MKLVGRVIATWLCAALSILVVLGNEQLGTVHFAVSGSPDAKEHVVRGVKLLHHMMYQEADRAFAAAAAADPECSLAYWGRAMTLIHPLWPDAPTDGERRQGAEFVRKGLACSKQTPREHAYLEILALFFNADPREEYAHQLQRLDDAWADLAEQYPEDLDALAFSALYHLAPARFLPKDKSHRRQFEAAERLQVVAKQIPEHPGAQHYRIHAFDSPLLADRALEVCSTYGSIAPEVPHALHMPTHIFTRRGLWEQSIDFNRRSADAGRRLDEAAGMVSSHQPHALDYLAYAYLQRGQYAEVAAVQRELATLKGPFAPGGLNQIGFAFAAVPARFALERQAWAEAAELPLHEPTGFPWGNSFLNCDSIVRFARGLGAARSGRLNVAREELAALARVREELAATNRVSYWTAQADSQQRAIRAWIAYAEGQQEEGIALLCRAVEIEAGVEKEAVTPGEVLPAGDLLGDMLTEAGRHEEALAAYTAVLSTSPNRLYSLFGAGHAAEQAGRNATAREHYAQLLAIVSAKESIARVEHARAFLSRTP